MVMENVKRQKGKIRKLLEQILGWSCLMVGILGLFLPFLQGVLLILMGVIFLSATYPSLKVWIEKEFAKIETRHSKARPVLRAIEKVYINLVKIFEVRN